MPFCGEGLHERRDRDGEAFGGGCPCQMSWMFLRTDPETRLRFYRTVLGSGAFPMPMVLESCSSGYAYSEEAVSDRIRELAVRRVMDR